MIKGLSRIRRSAGVAATCLVLLGAGACGPTQGATQPPPAVTSSRSSNPSPLQRTQTPDAATAQWTFLVVRHADRADDGSDDPPLTRAGEERADRLAGLMSPRPGVGVYATRYTRAQRTAAPTAADWQVPVTTYDAATEPAELIRTIKEKHPWGAILIVGHGDTVPPLVDELCQCQVAPIADDDFGNLYEIGIAADDAVVKAEQTTDY